MNQEQIANDLRDKLFDEQAKLWLLESKMSTVGVVDRSLNAKNEMLKKKCGGFSVLLSDVRCLLDDQETRDAPDDTDTNYCCSVENSERTLRLIDRIDRALKGE